MSVEDRVKKVIVAQLGVADDKVTPDASLVGDLGADDLDLMELGGAFEEEFNIDLEDEGEEDVRTVQDAIDLVRRGQRSEDERRRRKNR